MQIFWCSGVGKAIAPANSALKEWLAALVLLKARMLLGKTAHPPTLKDSAVDAEIEELRSKLKKL
ncbi:hypothetical protein D3800_04465 [Microcystis aeruginosa NIES-298]|uniref:Uncharacterized protein n=1 Tax=Microcystis aeruginosa NIES-298 TaxID=449468 RepID=A0A2H6BSD1_MICAE|nr:MULTISPECIES: hypothetical protein [Microcystis]MDB9404612.1 hypothetical protein [Microcystis sp. CS-574]MDB9545113.1 hypothetical protein [Microcystis aeruginosa CS-1036]QHU82659.1 hypothetical protein D3800_04465 [Microcystis aeruginosa NIES-298]GBD53068.1 hypothetical protein BGM30_21610 [Microcystis aeruginosa NIES-298]GBE99689.1 hypothetical protein NIES298_39370 [Microcystis aeruginosa NIES-298]